MEVPVTDNRKLQKCGVASLSLGLLLLVVSAVAIPLLGIFVHKEVSKRVVLTNGSETYDMWREPTIAIYVQFYTFNVKNPAEVKQGEKPVLEQRGPYTYQEHREKVDIVHHDNGTVTYRQIKTYHFVRNLSVGPDSEKFTTVNIPIITLMNYLKWRPVLKKLESIIHKYLSQIFITRSVREIVFGYSDPMLALGKFLYPKRFYTSIIGILAGKNNTDDGVYTIYTGEKDISKLGIINKYNGTRDQPHGKYLSLGVLLSPGCTCYAIDDHQCVADPSGSDVFSLLEILEYSTGRYGKWIRSVYGVYQGEIKSQHDGITLHRYRATKQVIADWRHNPYNVGFCTPNKDHCFGSGVLNLTTCQSLDYFQIPIVASFPHFYLADKKYTEAVVGLNPDPLQHTTDIDLEPTTGIVMQIAKRLQINVYIENITDYRLTSDPDSPEGLVLPVLWLNESAVIDASHARKVKNQLLIPVRVAQLLIYIGLSIGGFLFVTGLVYTVCTRRKQSLLEHSINTKEEDITANETDPSVADDSQPLMD